MLSLALTPAPPAPNLERHTERALRDLYARERMRLGWYRQVARREPFMKRLRERKAQHAAFLLDLMRRRGWAPAWYARGFYLAGHAFGLFAALLPDALGRWLEATLERWIMLRYRRYHRALALDRTLRSMIEAVQLRKLDHAEPGLDVLAALERFSQDQEALLLLGPRTEN